MLNFTRFYKLERIELSPSSPQSVYIYRGDDQFRARVGASEKKVCHIQFLPGNW